MVLATLERVAGKLRSVLADLEPERLSGADAERLLQVFTDIEKLAAGGKLLTARRVDSSNVWRRSGHRSAASHIAEAAGTGIGPAINTLQAARQLTDLPAAEDAVRKGQLSEVQVREITSAASQLPAAEGELVKSAVEEPLNVLKLRCRRAKAAGKGHGATYRAIHRARYLRNWVDDDGAVRLDAKLTPDAGARLVGAVKAEAARLGAQVRKAGGNEPDRALAVDALVDLTCRSQADGPSSSPSPTGSGSGSGEDGGRSTRGTAEARRRRSRPSRPRHGAGEPVPATMVHVRVDHAALLRGHTEPGEVCEIPGIGPVPVEVAQALATDSILSVLVTDGVDVRAVAHAGRTIPASLRRALLERDPTCVVPGCDARSGLEIDHVVPFADGGTTSLGNLARLCRWHHYLKTHQGHRLERQGRRWIWTPPTETGPRLL
jgi:hypothetical protein